MSEEIQTDQKGEVEWEDHLAAFIKALRHEMKERGTQLKDKEFVKHARAARREMLLALRALVDEALAATEEPEEHEPKAERITIE